ncbi:LuxR C-terminal-related transcriptional regulator [Serratia liquefaciens]|uniref:LuxR C-terminal-related transcriptional regulator n=1 Tax=Serratia liquefaciens TaxID=614 RepID=UPI001CAA45D3|nr:LuxR C-terminal-related transcriptional regulator [Serratia liquefaciens]
MSDEYLRLGLECVLEDSILQSHHDEEIKIYTSCNPDCDAVFIDTDNISMSVSIRVIKSVKCDVKVFVISSRKRVFDRMILEFANKFVFIHKCDKIDVLKNTIKSNFGSMLLGMEQHKNLNASPSVKYLTRYQRVVINLIQIGFSVKEIANMLRISERTVSSHKRSAMSKLGATTNHELYELMLFERVNGSFNETVFYN